MNTDDITIKAVCGTCKFSDTRTYMFAAMFILGNVLFPQLCHLVPGGGVTWLPIYFFTLIGAYLFGWRVGLLTALASPIINSFMFGMPPVSALPAIMVKSSLLAFAASVVSRLSGKATLLSLLVVVLFYQLAGTACEWFMGASWHVAFQDFRLGIPGMLVQVLGGYLLIRYCVTKIQSR